MPERVDLKRTLLAAIDARCPGTHRDGHAVVTVIATIYDAAPGILRLTFVSEI